MVFEALWTYLKARGSTVTWEINQKKKFPRPELDKVSGEEEDVGTGDTESL